MSEFMGTPGPWEVMNDDGEFKVVQSGSIEYGDGWKSYCDICSEVSMTQNARLIAAAPELLEALQEMVAIVKKNTYPQPDKPSSTWGRMEAAEAVIDKALGNH